MTHSSGISTTQELRTAFANANNTDSNIRLIKAQIREEEVVPVTQHDKSASENEDFNTYIEGLLESRVCCYILFKLDLEGWLLVSFVPDGSTVRDRMLYASTRETVKKELGSNNFTRELYATQPDEATWETLLYRTQNPEGAPKSLKEEIRAESRNLESLAISEQAAGGSSGKAVKFPMSHEAQEALKGVIAERPENNWVSLRVDAEKETVELVAAKNADSEALSAEVDSESPRFYFYQFTHTQEEQDAAALVFIYSCPENAKVKEKMLYSTVKSSVLEVADSLLVVPSKRLEIRDAADLSADFLLNELYPDTKKDAGAKISRPTRAGRGGARLMSRRT